MKNLNLMLAVIVLLLTVSGAVAQEAANLKNPNGEWSNVQLLQPGQMIYVKSKSGESFRGTVDKVTESSIIVVGRKRAPTFERENISKINLATVNNVTKTLGGVLGGIGGLIGTTAIIVQSPGGEGRSWFNVAAIVGGTVGGAYLGRALGKKWRKANLIYQAK